MTTEKAMSVVLNSKNMEKAANVVGLFLIGGGIGSVIIGIGLMHTAPKLAQGDKPRTNQLRKKCSIAIGLFLDSF